MDTNISSLSESESRIVKNYNDDQINHVTKELVNGYLIPKLMSTFPGLSGISTDYKLYQQIVRDSLMGEKTKITKQQFHSSYKYFKHLESQNMIFLHKSNTKIIENEEPDVDALSLTDEAKEIEKILKENRLANDDFEFANALWCLSKANNIEEKERETRFSYIQKILHVITLAMAEVEDGRILWNTLHPTVKELVNWVKLVGKYDEKGRSDMSYDIAADYLNKMDVQGMLSNAGLLSFQKNKVGLHPMYSILKIFNNSSLTEIERILKPTESISKKVNEVIKSEIKMSESDKEFAP